MKTSYHRALWIILAASLGAVSALAQSFLAKSLGLDLVAGVLRGSACVTVSLVPCTIAAVVLLASVHALQPRLEKRRPDQLRQLHAIPLSTKILDYLVAATIAAILVVIAIPNFCEAQVRALLSRWRSDLRSFTVMLDAYRTDHGHYPFSTTGTHTLNGQLMHNPDLYRLPGVRLDYGLRNPFQARINGLLNTYPSDAFGVEEGARPVYLSINEGNTPGWIAVSPGPDHIHDLDPTGLFDPAADGPSSAMLVLTYDPTNGVLSNGDVWHTNRYPPPRYILR